MKSNYKNKWLYQRITAILLLPLSFWFIYQCISFQYLAYEEIKLFFESLTNSALFLIMILLMLIHSKIGCETIIQDYISTKKFQIIFKKLIYVITLILIILVIVAVFKLSFY